MTDSGEYADCTVKLWTLDKLRPALIFLLLILFSGHLAAIPGDPSSRFRFTKMMLEDDCDACGCSANGGSMGFSSVFSNNFVGVRYLYQRYESRDGMFDNSPWLREDFNTIQVWARIPISSKLQVSVLIPYHHHTRYRAAGDENISGLGDVTVLAMYAAYETSRDSTEFTHRLQLGGGIKAPTGKFDTQNNKGSVNPGFQVGTGSWDYLAVAEYVVKRSKIGLQAMAVYTFKTENKKLYEFGDQLSYSGTLFYLFDNTRVKWVPQVGLAGETYDANTQYRQKIPDSAGNVLFAKVGLEGGLRKFSAGLNALLPVSQNLSSGRVESKYRLSVNLNYSL